MTLKQMLSLMDLPKNRLDLTKLENIRWLVRNLGIKNKHHKYYGTCIWKLKWILSENK